jgi:predicted protein tyrosine phosphatase
VKVLFVCSRNRLRSPTAEAVFADVEGLDVASAGTSPDAEEMVTSDLLEWADLVVVMEARHKRALTEHYGSSLRGRRLVVLNIPDRYEYMDPELVALLRKRVGPYLSRTRAR